MKRKSWNRFLCSGIILCLITGSLTGCSDSEESGGQTGNIDQTETFSQTEEKDQSESPENSSGEQALGQNDAETLESIVKTEFVYDPIEWDSMEEEEDFAQMFDASEASTTGNVKLESRMDGFSGEGYLTGFESDGDSCAFQVNIPAAGSFDITIVSAGIGGEKVNDIGVDGNIVGNFTTSGEKFGESVLKSIYIEEGEHTISIQKNWGWIALDSLSIASSERLPGSAFQVDNGLVNPSATDRTVKLMQYLQDMYGSYVLSGQFADNGIYSPEIIAIKKVTEKMPAVLGLDFMNYTPVFVQHGANASAIERALEYDQLGGIITFCWHWAAPEKYHKKDATWYRTFYTDSVDIDLTAILNGKDEEGYELLVQDIDAIAEQVSILQEADVPILFRPLHEASGAWFWWGASGPESYIQLWKLVFDRMTNYHGLNNIIWVWNGQSAEWYPGDAYVDIIGEDLYPGNRVYSSQSGKFREAVEYPQTSKIVAMTENGCLFDPDLAFRDQAPWAWFCTWSGEFVVQNGYHVLSEEYTEEYMVKKVYQHERVITLDELPDLKNYVSEQKTQ